MNPQQRSRTLETPSHLSSLKQQPWPETKQPEIGWWRRSKEKKIFRGPEMKLLLRTRKLRSPSKLLRPMQQMPMEWRQWKRLCKLFKIKWSRRPRKQKRGQGKKLPKQRSKGLRLSCQGWAHASINMRSITKSVIKKKNVAGEERLTHSNNKRIWPDRTFGVLMEHRQAKKYLHVLTSWIFGTIEN